MMSRTKIALSLRVDPDIKTLGEQRARADRRSFASYIEWLVDTDTKNRPVIVNHQKSEQYPIGDNLR